LTNHAISAAGPGGDVWFTTVSSFTGVLPAVGVISPAGNIELLHTGLGQNDAPDGITEGPGNAMWFADDGFQRKAIGEVSTTPPTTIAPARYLIACTPDGHDPLQCRAPALANPVPIAPQHAELYRRGIPIQAALVQQGPAGRIELVVQQTPPAGRYTLVSTPKRHARQHLNIA
jgi:hypothetical protein